METSLNNSHKQSLWQCVLWRIHSESDKAAKRGGLQEDQVQAKMLDAWKRMSLSEILHFRVQLSSGKCKSDILVCHIYSSSAISIPNSLSLQVNTMFFALTASTASSACYLRIKLCSFCLLKHRQLQSFWNQTLAGSAVGEAGHLSTTWLAHPSHRNERGRKKPNGSINSAHMLWEAHRKHLFSAPRCHFYAITCLTVTAFHDGAAKQGAK